VAYFPLSRVVASSAPIHISNSLAVHGQVRTPFFFFASFFRAKKAWIGKFAPSG